MVKAKILANAVAVVTGVVFGLCRLLAAVAPNLLFNIGQSWWHTLNLSSLKATSSMTLGLFLVGLISSVVFAWLITYAVAELYNRWE